MAHQPKSQPAHAPAAPPLSREQQIRKAVVSSFCDPPPPHSEQLRNLSPRAWKRLLHWLDTSGLALYFLDRLHQLGRADMLPPEILQRIEQNRTDNAERINEIIAESIDIQTSFQQHLISYAVLKGFSLWPVSVPDPALRSQLDTDYLLAEADAAKARLIVESHGYYLHAISGRSYEFKTQQELSPIRDLYKPNKHRSLEFHIEPASTEHDSLLARTGTLRFHGIDMPVLSPVDLFLGQALHLYKHVCGEFWRTAHMIELRRHIVARYHDDEFWSSLRQPAENNSRARIGLGVVTLLITRVMGEFAPEALTSWTVDRLPPPARLWVELYGHRAALGSHPGSKLYLLLQTSLEQSSSLPAKRSLRQSLVPRKLPPSIERATVNETLAGRLRRYRRQLYFILFRLHFHFVEGLRYARESARWQRILNSRP